MVRPLLWGHPASGEVSYLWQKRECDIVVIVSCEGYYSVVLVVVVIQTCMPFQRTFPLGTHIKRSGLITEYALGHNCIVLLGLSLWVDRFDDMGEMGE